LHRFTRDSFAGAACAGPDGPNTPAGHAHENLRSTTIQRARGEDDGHRRREEWRYRGTASDSPYGALSGRPASASIAAVTSDGKFSARHNAWPILETSSSRAAI
jgi:hypothetical protein